MLYTHHDFEYLDLFLRQAIKQDFRLPSFAVPEVSDYS